MPDEILVSDQVRSVTALRPALGDEAHRPVSDEADELLVAAERRAAEDGPPLFGVERQHRTDHVAEIANQEELLCSRIELQEGPGGVVGAVLPGEVDGPLPLALARGDPPVALFDAMLAEGR